MKPIFCIVKSLVSLVQFSIILVGMKMLQQFKLLALTSLVIELHTIKCNHFRKACATLHNYFTYENAIMTNNFKDQKQCNEMP